MPLSRRDLLRSAVVVGLGNLVFACDDPETPIPITFDRDTCTHCAMLISERRFAAEAYDPVKRKIAKYDDIGCMFAHACETGLVTNPKAHFWVMDADTAKDWLDARSASYSDGAPSPMGYGFAAHAPGKAPIAFAAVVDAADRRAHCRPNPT